MLVFTRKTGESLMIGDEIEVTILAVGRDQIKIGIEAPRQIPIHRREVYETITEQNLKASQSQIPSGDILSRLRRKGGS